MDKRNKVLSFILAAALLVLPSAAAFAATTIGNNVSVGGTLGSTGLSTLTGGFISNASSSMGGNLQVAGFLGASSTFVSAGLSTFSAGFISSASSSVSGGLNVNGMLNVSSGIMYTGSIVASASGACGPTGCFVVDNGGNISASGTLSVGKPSATTTVNIGNLGVAASKTCFNVQNTAGSNISFYFVGTTLTVENNACR